MDLSEFVVGGVAAGTLVTVGTQIIKIIFEWDGVAARATAVVLSAITMLFVAIARVADPSNWGDWASAAGVWWAGTILVAGYSMGLYNVMTATVDSPDEPNFDEELYR